MSAPEYKISVQSCQKLFELLLLGIKFHNWYAAYFQAKLNAGKLPKRHFDSLKVYKSQKMMNVLNCVTDFFSWLSPMIQYNDQIYWSMFIECFVLVSYPFINVFSLSNHPCRTYLQYHVRVWRPSYPFIILYLLDNNKMLRRITRHRKQDDSIIPRSYDDTKFE